jgi:hypothetical protein
VALWHAEEIQTRCVTVGSWCAVTVGSWHNRVMSVHIVADVGDVQNGFRKLTLSGRDGVKEDDQFSFYAFFPVRMTPCCN